MPKKKFDAGAVVDLLSDVSDICNDDDESDFDITMVLSDSETDGGEESDDDSPNDQTGNTIPGVTVGFFFFFFFFFFFVSIFILLTRRKATEALYIG